MFERIQVSLQRRLLRCLRQAFEATATATAGHGDGVLRVGRVGVGRQDTPLTHPWGLDGAIHGANGP
ncbi:hypothetical protein, partial [Stenotrophomonas maltophilia]|uniref:hypothetical protein n=1 Tax=Stenotrophomonas maltophilia TaxID=40324 RepID=UPI0019557D69